jgi:DNA-binding NtrC family response regulator
VLTGSGQRRIALDAIRRGAHDFLHKPVDPDVLAVVLQRAASRAGLEAKLSRLQQELDAGRPEAAMIGDSQAFSDAVRIAERVAPTPLPVLITGENGTGKELLARRVHAASPRCDGPFVVVNCGALPPNLLESTLFGHVRGAFTGADRDRRGLVVEADGGTLFLDEIGDTEPATQVRLLRVLENQEVLPVGADRPVQVDVRFVSATHQPLPERMAEGAFRDDLYWRLRGMEVHLPPLREREDDVGLLAMHFAREAAAMMGMATPPSFTDAAWDRLRAHPWPGNLRELRQTVRRGVVMARGAVDVADLGLAQGASSADGATLAEQVARLERRAIAAEGGNRSRAAKRLGLSRQGLLNKIARYDLD